MGIYNSTRSRLWDGMRLKRLAERGWCDLGSLVDREPIRAVLRKTVGRASPFQLEIFVMEVEVVQSQDLFELHHELPCDYL